ncbi:hypothetical protein QA648_17900 [Rhizobium sp. CB3171]|uniref:hypothetical protein n=1 Tax=Rhizobium sp. CB3171 TaxID=3039157 RepID=UPI0024B11F98|nr:hypothetical protein [Rhizobium sp. CB3171]WFU01950.1 hypothetical protein QA648_17900 [Rhizobium sp. CB3171]
MRALLSLMLIPLLATSCAGVQVKRVTSRDQSGIRYWRPAPYLALVETKTDKTVTCDVKSFYLPDKTEEYAITISAGMGAVKATPTLTDGWNLTSLSTDVDSKTNENITAIKGLLKEAAGIVGPKHLAPPASPPAKCEGIFKVEYDQSGNFKGFKKIPLAIN